jgi:general secretion pathway protein G
MKIYIKTINNTCKKIWKITQVLFSHYFSIHHSQFSISLGFTLVELLVVISLIGILASIMIVNIGGFRERVRDTERKKDILQLQTALELYRSDVSAYPAALPGCGSNLSNAGTVYMQKVPCDPLGTPAWGASYKYTLVGGAYTLYACLENANDSEKDSTKQAACGATAKASYTVTSP